MPISVRDYGALGDGVADDSAAIQAALDAVPGGGGTVLVPAGDYRLGSTLAIRVAGTWLRGVGPTSILRLMDGVKEIGIGIPAAYLESFDTSALVDGITVSDLTLDGNRNPISPTGSGPDYFGIFVRQASNLALRRLHVKDWASDGISISNGYRPSSFVVEDCLVSGCHRNGIHVGYASSGAIRGSRVVDTPSQYWGPSAANGIDVEVEGYDLLGPDPHLASVRDLIIEDNFIARLAASTAGDAIALQPAYGPLSGVTIRRNFLSGHQYGVQTTGSRGIYGEVAGVHDVEISANWFTCDPDYAVIGNAVELIGASGVAISGNVVNEGDGGLFSGRPFGVYDSANVTISGNAVHAMDTVASTVLYAAYASDGISVTGNSYRTQGGTVVDGDGTATDVTQSGNTSLAGVAWDRVGPACSLGLADGATIASPTTVTVAATDAGSAVARVYFLVDGLPRGHSDAAPYAFEIDPADFAAGAHTLSAVAVDSGANLGAEVAVSVTIGESGPAGARGRSRRSRRLLLCS